MSIPEMIVDISPLIAFNENETKASKVRNTYMLL